MEINLKRTPRLYVDQPLGLDQAIALSPDQGHYLGRVMRLSAQDHVRIFNGEHGEWLCTIEQISKRGALVIGTEKISEAQTLPDVDYLFAPLKTARLDYMAQKATEMGAGRIRPVITEFTQGKRFKFDRLVANTIEAAEQCNLVCLPQVLEPVKLPAVIRDWDGTRQLIFCDESAQSSSPIEIISKFKGQPTALLIGPEGGFSEREREMLLSQPFVTAISLGPRIMRADTAAVAALALVQATIGDWQSSNRS